MGRSAFSTPATVSGLADGFDYIGIIATMGELIGRVSLDGQQFAIENIQFNFADVDGEIPLPAGLLLFPAGLAALRLASRRRKAAA